MDVSLSTMKRQLAVVFDKTILFVTHQRGNVRLLALFGTFEIGLGELFAIGSGIDHNDW